MATKIKQGAWLERELQASLFECGKVRNLIVLVENRSIGFRLKGTHKTYWLDALGLYHRAVIAEVKAKEKEKKERRKGKGRK